MLFTMVKLSEILSGFVLLQAAQMEETSPCGIKRWAFTKSTLSVCFTLSLKCLYYAFSNITFHAVCHVAVCEHKLPAKL